MHSKEINVSLKEKHCKTIITRRRHEQKVYECTRCFYISERKFNVDRHFDRFHCELKKHKLCICGKTFTTKEEYYYHCSKVHHNDSWYFTDKLYKFEKLKSKIPMTKNSIGSRYIIKFDERKSRVTSSRRLFYKVSKSKKIVVDDSLTIQSSSDVSSESDEENIQEQQIQCFDQLEDIEKEESEIHEQMKWSNVALCEKHEINLTLCPAKSLRHLPLKKRFAKCVERKCLSELTNFNNNRSRETFVYSIKTDIENLNSNEIRVGDHSLANIDEQQRAFISQIDFDELDAILNLMYLKSPIMP